MTRENAVVLYQNLQSIGDLKGVKFAYAVAKNSNILKREIDALNTAIKPLPGFEAYDTARVELAKKFAKKDEKGEPVIEDNQYVLEDKPAFDIGLAELRESFKETLEIRQTQLDEYKKLLAEEVGLTLHKVKLDDVPKEITVDQMTALQEMIED